MRFLIAAALFSLICGQSTGQQAAKKIDWPKPEDVKALLFYIQRDPDTNTVCYAANVKEDGSLDPDQPIDVFWMNYATDGKRSDLTALQRCFAYGVTLRNLKKDSVDFRIVSVPGRRLVLRADSLGKYWVQTVINGHPCRLARVYLNITGGPDSSAELSYVEIQGYGLNGGLIETERIRVK